MILKIVNIVLWLLAGMIVLNKKEVSKIEYALTWITLILRTIVDLFS